jgi:flagellar protein FliJ
MKKFRFRLEKVLEHRVRLYDIARTKFVEALRKLRCEEEKLEVLSESYKQCLLELIDKTKSTFRVRDIGAYYRYITFLKREIAVQSQKVHEAMEEKELRRKELLHATKNKEVLVKLKDKRHNEYKYELDREEQKLIDESATSKHIRTQKVALEVSQNAQ